LKIITKYIIKEHVSPFLFALLTIIFLFLLNAIFRDLGRLLSKGVSLKIIMQFFALNLAWIAALAVPMSVLVSTLMAFGRMSADHEITAIKAGGMNFYSLVLPVALVSLVLAVGMERFNNVVLPESNHQYRMLYSDISTKRPTLSLEENVFNKIQQYTLFAEKIDSKTNHLTGIIINDRSDSHISRTIIAKSGDLYISVAQERLVFQLYDGEVHEVALDDLDNYRRASFKKQTLTIDIPNTVLRRREYSHRGNREKSAAMMRQDLLKEQDAIRQTRERIRDIGERDIASLLPASFWPQGSSEEMTSREGLFIYQNRPVGRVEQMRGQVRSLLSGIENHEKEISSLKVEINKKYSIPLACFVFVLIGAPLGIMARHGGLAAGGGLSLIFFIIYWVFLIGGEQLADRRLLQPWLAMWSPNVLVGGIGLYLMIHSVRETTVIHWEWFSDVIRKIKGKNA